MICWLMFMMFVICLQGPKLTKQLVQTGSQIKFLEYYSQQLADVFTGIFQTCLNTGDIPHIWKSSIIIPVPKLK